MSDLKARFKPLFRRTSTLNSAKSSITSVSSAAADKRGHSSTSLLLSKNRKPSGSEPVPDEREESVVELPLPPPITKIQPVGGGSQKKPDTSLEKSESPPLKNGNPSLQVEEPTTQHSADFPKVVEEPAGLEETVQLSADIGSQVKTATSLRPAELPRTQSLAHSSQSRFLTTLLANEKSQPHTPSGDYFHGPPALSASMLHRKIWVKRPGASATLVSINEDDLVDDVRDFILRKYANSLGRTFDAPDITLKITPRDHARRNSQGERVLGPEEPISRTLDAYFPGGQSVEEALIIDVPQRRTPRQSPRLPVPYYLAEDLRPGESGTEYFPPMPAASQHSPNFPLTLSKANTGSGGAHHQQQVHSIAILNTGQPSLPSPNSRGIRHPHTTQLAHGSLRPKHARTHTSSPPIITENLKTHANGIPVAPPLPNPPHSTDTLPHRATTPSPRPSSPRPKISRRRPKKSPEAPRLPAGLLDGAVPPINVLIVEDNIINLKLLEAFLKRLKVRWKTAMNGRDAVTKWRAGGFHLVLMDIQLPVMNGLDATKEIRRLERLNNIGVLSGSASNTANFCSDHEAAGNGRKAEGEDCLTNRNLFKSPVIIVALTASSLQSDRHEALAAGCNDFLTKPVNFVWLERKVMEWGCMQALIDFDGWRKWKDFSSSSTSQTPQSTVAAGTGTPAGGSNNKLFGSHHKNNTLATTAANKGSSGGGSNATGSVTVGVGVGGGGGGSGGGSSVKFQVPAGGLREKKLSSSSGTVSGGSTGTGTGTGTGSGDLLEEVGEGEERERDRETRGVGTTIVARA